MKQILLLSLLTAFLFASGQESGMQFEHDASWQQILDKARNENKYIFLDAFASWCGPCKWMAKEVFPKHEVGKVMNQNYINAKIDMEKGEGIDLAKKYNVRNYPTYLFFDSNGELVHRSLGSMPATDFIALCTNTLNPEKQFITLQNKYLKGNRDTAFLRMYIENANNAQDSTAQPALKEFLSAVYYELSPENTALIAYATNSIHDTGYVIIQANKETFYSHLGKDEIDYQIEELVWNEGRKAAKKENNIEAFKKIIQQYLPEKTDALFAEYELSILKRTNDWKAYLPKALLFAEKYCNDDFDRLNNIAYTIFENYKEKETLGKALNFALRSVELKNRFDNNDTVARLYYKLNNKIQAKKFGEKAFELAKDEGAETDDIESFLKILK